MNLWEKGRFIHRAWRYRLRTEAGPIRFMFEHLRRGDTALDIGANKGAYSYWMSRLCGSTGRVFAFEPQPDLAKYLERAKTACGLSQLTVAGTGLSSTAGTGSLFKPDGNPLGGASLEAMDGEGTRIDVRTITLDEYLADAHLADAVARPVRFIKCDVEGHELEVFLGGKQILEEDRPAMVFECQNFRHETGQIGRVMPMFEELGYQIFFFDGRQARPYAEFDVALHQANRGEGYRDNFCLLPPARAMSQAA